MNTLQATVSLSRNQQPHRSVSEPLYIALGIVLFSYIEWDIHFFDCLSACICDQAHPLSEAGDFNRCSLVAAQ